MEMHCKVCLENDGVTSAKVVQARVANSVTDVQFDAWVCSECQNAGRETRVTCRTFADIGAEH